MINSNKYAIFISLNLLPEQQREELVWKRLNKLDKNICCTWAQIHPTSLTFLIVVQPHNYCGTSSHANLHVGLHLLHWFFPKTYFNGRKVNPNVKMNKCIKFTKHHFNLVRNYTEKSKHITTISVSLLTRPTNDSIPNALQQWRDFLLFNVLLLWKFVFNPFKYNKDQANLLNSRHQPKNVERSW